MSWYIFAQNTSVKIPISQAEGEIFSIIKSARDLFAQGVQLRVVGGWVRDKIMGKSSDDIDIAITGGNGDRMAEAVRKYDLQFLNEKHTGLPYSVSLEKEQDNSRTNNLKVGGISINNIKIEFVPMRKESYSQDSRTPHISATDDPQEDVKRRDLTINAIYYNIDSGQIEDYVGGLEDISNGLLRTPEDPITTLNEDPLRAIRVLRFLSQLQGFKIDEKLIEALKNPTVHNSYLTKVAPERAKKEIEKLVLGDRPGDAVRILFSTGLYLPVFNSQRLNNFNPIHMNQNTSHHQLNLLEHTVGVVKNLNDMLIESKVPERERMISVLAAIFHDFGKMDPDIVKPKASNPQESSYPGHEDVSAELAEEILKRLGFGSDRHYVVKVVKEHMRPHGENHSPKSIGKFLRDFESMDSSDTIKDRLWWLTYTHAIADSMSKGAIDYDEDVKGKKDTIKTIEQFIEERSKIGTKSILDGREIMELFPELNPKTGFIAKMQKQLIEEQDSGGIKDKDSAKLFLQKLNKK